MRRRISAADFTGGARRVVIFYAASIRTAYAAARAYYFCASGTTFSAPCTRTYVSIGAAYNTGKLRRSITRQ
jgi:hypothetical protein